MNMADENLKLDKQLCFALYVCSKEIIREYKPLLEPLGLTYTMYIALMALWEQDSVTVHELGNRLYLDSGTLTPLLKKMEKDGLVIRNRSAQDERSVIITLTPAGKALKTACTSIPEGMFCSTGLQLQEAASLLGQLHVLMDSLKTGNE